MPRINVIGYKIRVPGHPIARIGMGGLLVTGGFLGFLPVLGYWMLPVGIAILAIDFPPVRRFQRRMNVRLGNWLHRKWPRFAGKLGYGKPRDARLQVE
jgi:purine-cytosine permease-like protein